MLPRTNFHLLHHSPVEMVFWGQLPIERGTSFVHYEGMRIREAIHCLKYRNAPEIGMYMAEVFATEIKDSGFFEDIDCIVPVPLTRLRRWKRGYNQCEWIAKGISRQTGIPVLRHVVKRVVDNPTQTRLVRYERWDNVQGIFRMVCPELVAGKHILLVDDVMTTGATLISCGMELAKAGGGVRISVATLGVAGMGRIAACTDDEEPLPLQWSAEVLQ